MVNPASRDEFAPSVVMVAARGASDNRTRPAPFVVTGCGRSGTKYMAEVLKRCGLKCDHEGVFDPPVRSVEIPAGLDGDVSWAAAPFVSAMASGTKVLHQVRHPLDVISSFVSLRFFADPPSWSFRNDVAHRAKARLVELLRRVGALERRVASSSLDYLRLALEHAPGIFEERTEVDRAARYWIEWNALVERLAANPSIPYVRYKIEDLDSTTLAAILEFIGHTLEEEMLVAALRTVPQHTNKKTPTARLRWDDVRPGLIDELTEHSARYGYEPAS